MELLEQNEDNARAEKKQKQKKDEAFDKVSDDVKADTVAEALNLVQTSSDIGGIFQSSAENPDTEESLSDLARNARETADAAA